MKMEMQDTKACIDVCNSLLRGELSAVETYSLAINRYVGKPAVTELQKIRTEHALSAASSGEISTITSAFSCLS